MKVLDKGFATATEPVMEQKTFLNVFFVHSQHGVCP